MSLTFSFHFLYAQHILDIRVAGWSTASACNTDNTPTHPTPKLEHTSNQEQYDQCGNSTEESQAADDGYINVRNMLSTQEVKWNNDIKLVFYSMWIKLRQMQQYADIYSLQKYSTCFGCHSTHHQDY